MSKHTARKRAQAIFDNLLKMSVPSWSDDAKEMPFALPKQSGLLRMKKFRFQLMYQWLSRYFVPGRVADVGGGKGLLAYLLQQQGWQATVIDPVFQTLPNKYKDIASNKRVLISSAEQVPHIDNEFEPDMAEQFDLVIGIHAHGCNIKIIDGVRKFDRECVLMPCCIIDEPLYPRLGVHWLECLVDYALKQGLSVYPFRLHFKGQNIGFYAHSRDDRPGENLALSRLCRSV